MCAFILCLYTLVRCAREDVRRGERDAARGKVWARWSGGEIISEVGE